MVREEDAHRTLPAKGSTLGKIGLKSRSFRYAWRTLSRTQITYLIGFFAESILRRWWAAKPGWHGQPEWHVAGSFQISIDSDDIGPVEYRGRTNMLCGEFVK